MARPFGRAHPLREYDGVMVEVAVGPGVASGGCSRYVISYAMHSMSVCAPTALRVQR